MEPWLKRILQFLFRLWFKRTKTQALNKAKEQGVKTYLKVLQGIRLSGLGLVTLALVLHLTAFGLALMVGSMVFLSPFELETKLWLVFTLGCVLFLLPMIAIAIVFNERLWYQASGAEKMVNSVIEKSRS